MLKVLWNQFFNKKQLDYINLDLKDIVKQPLLCKNLSKEHKAWLFQEIFNKPQKWQQIYKCNCCQILTRQELCLECGGKNVIIKKLHFYCNQIQNWIPISKFNQIKRKLVA